MHDDHRLPFLDALRVIALGLLIPYHVGMYYVSWDWHVKSPFAGPALEPWMALSNPWRMSLLFLVSGAVTALMPGRTSPGWLAGRMKRLGLPLLAGMLVVVPPQSYFQVVQQLGYDGHYGQFLLRYLSFDRDFCDARGQCLVVPTWNHLWFLPYLMLYTVLLWLSLRRAPGALDRAAACLSTRLGPLTLWLAPTALLVLGRLLLRPWFPVTHALVDDPLAHVQFGLAFAVGALWARTPGAWPAVSALRWPALALGLAGWAAAQVTEGAPAWALRSGFAVQQWCGVLAAVGFGVRHLNRRDGLFARASTAVFPVYVLHQTLIIVLAMAWRPLALPPWLEAPLLVATTLVLALAGHAGIRRVAWLRPWFGLAVARPPLQRTNWST